MNELDFFEPISPLARELSLRLMFAMLHFLWQGSLIGILLAVATKMLRSASAEACYGTNVAALAALAMCLPLNFAIIPVPKPVPANPGLAIATEPDIAESAGVGPLLPTAAPVLVVPNEARKASRGETVAFAMPVTRALPNAAPYVAALYAFGVGLMLMRLSASLWGGHRLRAASELVSDSALLALIAAQARSIGLRSAPAVAWCERVSVPMVVGIVRPLVLLPCSLATGLHRDQLAAIISHELAHIRRFDPVVNLFQRLIESLLFFHPAVWLVSRQVSSERELCCDNLVVRSGYGAVQYAGALIRIAELYIAKARPGLLPQILSLRASGEQRSELSRRVYRLLGATDSPKVGNLGSIALAGLLLVFVGAAMASVPIEQPNAAQTNGEDVSSGDGEAATVGTDSAAAMPEEKVTREKEPRDSEKADDTPLYQLREDQVLKWIPPQQRDDRPSDPQPRFPGEYYEPSATKQVYEQEGTDVRLKMQLMGGEPSSLHHVVSQLFRVFPCEMTGEAQAWMVRVPGDFVLRKGATRQQALKALEQTLRDDAGLKIWFRWEEEETEAWVVEGDFQPAPIGEPWRLPKEQYQAYVLYGKTGPGDERYPETGAGSFDDLLKAFGTRTGTPVINSLEETPSGFFGWEMYHDEFTGRLTNFPRHYAKNPDLVADHFREQTGLQLRRERRKVHLLGAYQTAGSEADVPSE